MTIHSYLVSQETIHNTNLYTFIKVQFNAIKRKISDFTSSLHEIVKLKNMNFGTKEIFGIIHEKYIFYIVQGFQFFLHKSILNIFNSNFFELLKIPSHMLFVLYKLTCP